MSSLAVLPNPPPKGTVTICEYNAQYMTEESTGRGINVPLIQMQDYPEIVPGLESFKSPHNLALELSTPAFLPTEEGLTAKLLHIWLSEGTKSVFEECHSEENQVPLWLHIISQYGLKLYEIIDKVYGNLFPHLAMSKEEIMAAFSCVADWSQSPYRAFAWHPHTSKFAVGSKDDSVRVYTLGSSAIPVNLKHKQQKDITCLVWRPLSSSDLAVGCCNGILLWHLDPNSSGIRPRSGSVRHLSRPGHTPVTTISWSPNGSLLASGSPVDSAMLIWDVSNETPTALKRVGGGSSFLRWSPDETKLFSATPSTLFRVWETKTFTMEKWSNFAKKCQCCCWSPKGDILLFAIEGDPSIFSLKFEQSPDDENSSDLIGGAKMAVKSVDLSAHTWNIGDEIITIGGSVHSMAWDPQGERLGIILKDETGKTQDLVVVFRTKLNPYFEIMACGTVRGPNGDIPQMISFQQNFNQGAMLTVCWLSGLITFIPLIFTPITQLTRDYVSPAEVSTRNGSLYSDNPGVPSY